MRRADGLYREDEDSQWKEKEKDTEGEGEKKKRREKKKKKRKERPTSDRVITNEKLRMGLPIEENRGSKRIVPNGSLTVYQCIGVLVYDAHDGEKRMSNAYNSR